MVFNSDFVLEPCLRTHLPYGKVVYSEGPVGYWQKQGYKTSTDSTNEILHRVIGEENVVHGQWDEKDSEANASIHLIPGDTEFIWWTDSDEFFFASDIEEILDILDSGEVDSVSFKTNSFYGGFERRITGFEENFEVVRIQRFYPGAKWSTHRPPTILSKDGQPWRSKKHLSHEDTDAMEIRMFHFSYTFPKQMWMKAQYYHDMSPTGTIPDYFNNIYLPWVLGDDKQKQAIEDKYDGVHDWLPQRRGSARTVPYDGLFPEQIELVLPELKQRFQNELEQFKR